jgi:uncharacterized cofD-like protein
VGDITKCLMALSKFHGDVRGEQLLTALNYRFDSGDFEGHTLRNVFLATLERTSDLDAGVAMMARLLQVPREAGVVPLTLQPVTEQVVTDFDEVERLLGEGQFAISHSANLQVDPRWKPGDVRVKLAESNVGLNERAQEVLREATDVVIAPGHTFGTILPALALLGLKEELSQLVVRLTVIMPLLTTPKQTEKWTGEDFIKVYESYLERKVDRVVANTGEVKVDLVDGQDWVRFTESEHEYELILDDLVATEEQVKQAGDVVPRAVVVHSDKKLPDMLF